MWDWQFELCKNLMKGISWSFRRCPCKVIVSCGSPQPDYISYVCLFIYSCNLRHFFFPLILPLVITVNRLWLFSSAALGAHLLLSLGLSILALSHHRNGRSCHHPCLSQAVQYCAAVGPCRAMSYGLIKDYYLIYLPLASVPPLTSLWRKVMSVQGHVWGLLGGDGNLAGKFDKRKWKYLIFTSAQMNSFVFSSLGTTKGHLDIILGNQL